MEKNKSLENICKATMSIFGAASLIALGSSSALVSYIGFTKMEHNYLNSLVALGTAIATPLFFIGGVFLGVYGINKIDDLTDNKEKRETYNFLKGFDKSTQNIL